MSDKLYDNVKYLLTILAAATLLLWFAAKQLGLINTPWYIAIIPVLSFGILLGAGLNDLRNIKENFGLLQSDVKELRNDMHSIDKWVSKLE